MKPISHLKSLGICIALSYCLSAQAQTNSITYNHDETKENQITIQELGAGSLTPEFYYKALHRNYMESARSKNKLKYRTQASTSAYQQVDFADSIEASMKARAEIEAKNMADRQVDATWLTEGSKITTKLSDFEKNINRIIRAGGRFSDKERWTEYYHIFQFSIKSVQDAYMPNAERKKQYLAIYADINRKNEQLIGYLVQLNRQHETAALLSASYTKPNRTAAIATAAHNRWRSASWLQ